MAEKKTKKTSSKKKAEPVAVDPRLEEATNTALGAFTAAIMAESDRIATSRTKSGFSTRVVTKDGRRFAMRITMRSQDGKKKTGARKKAAGKKKS